MKRTDKWYRPKKKDTGWEKGLPPTTRRRRMLRAKGNHLSAARACQALANVTENKQTAISARADARYFYEQNRKNKGG